MKTLQNLLMYSNYQFVIASISCTYDPPLQPVVLFFGSKYHALLHCIFQTVAQAS